MKTELQTDKENFTEDEIQPDKDNFMELRILQKIQN